MRTNKIISACLALCLVGSAVPFVDVGEFPVIVANAVEQTITMSQKASWSVTYTGNCGENIVWSFNPETGEFIISGTGKFESSYGDGYYSYGDKIKAVIIKEGITDIQMGAFDFCSEVVEVTLPESVVTIDSVFDRCPNVTNIMVSESNPYLCSIDGNVFSKDKTKLIQYAVGKNEMSYSIPEGVKSIERNAFHNSKLANINMPESITSIGDWAFCNCANLTSLVFPKNVLKIGWQAFWLSENIADITFFNPNCEGIPSSCVGKATIHGYENSTAQAYAIKLGCKFESLGKTPVQNSLSGDFNSDGDLTVTDVVEFNQKLRSRKALPKNCDMNGDNVVNVIDLALLKQKLLSK